MANKDVNKGLIWNVMDLDKSYNVRHLIIPCKKQPTISSNMKKMMKEYRE